MKCAIRKLTVFSILLVTASVAHAQLSGRDRNEIKKMAEGDLYLRNNVPCRYTAGGWGIGAEVITEISPSGIDWEKNLTLIKEKKRRGGVDIIYWGFGPNDLIRYGKLYFKGETIELWAEGAKPKNTEIWLRFVQIKNLDDFKKAYDQILSRKPLQDEHPEWSDDIKKAITDHRVIEGMTKTQAFCIVGTPIGIETGEKDGKKTETWFPRQDTGASGSYGKVISGETGFPISLQFVDGKLASIAQKGKSVKVDVNN
jgi:hypothetical protein